MLARFLTQAFDSVEKAWIRDMIKDYFTHSQVYLKCDCLKLCEVAQNSPLSAGQHQSRSDVRFELVPQSC